MKRINFQSVLIVISIIFSLLQLTSIMYFLNHNYSHMNLLIVICIPLLFLNYKYFKSDFISDDNIKSTMSLLLVSILVFISLFYRKVEYLNKVYILSGLGVISIIFFSLRFLQSGLESIAWFLEKRKFNILKYLLLFAIPAIVYGMCLAACYPGLISPDSLYIYNMAYASGPYNNLHPLIYTLFIRFMVILGCDIFRIMIVQVLLCAASYSYIAYSFNKLGLKYIYSLLMVIALTIYPINLFNAITFWKDIPYTIGLSLIAMELVKIALERDNSKKIQLSSLLLLTFATIITIFSRHNGILTVSLVYISTAIFYLIKKYKKHALTFTILLVSAIIAYYGVLNGAMVLLGDKYVVPEDNKVTETAKYALRIQGLISVYKNIGDELTDDEMAYIDKYLDLEKVNEHLEKYGVRSSYISRTKAYCDTEALLTHDGLTNKDFNKGYFNLLKKYPNLVINAYTSTTSIIWATPNICYTMHAAYPYDYFDTVDYPDIDFKIKSYIPKVKVLMQEIYDMEPTESYYALFWRPAIFMLAILFLWYYCKQRKLFGSFLIASPAIFNTLGYFIIIEAQDARYFYINMTIALIMFGYATIKRKKINE